MIFVGSESVSEWSYLEDGFIVSCVNRMSPLPPVSRVTLGPIRTRGIFRTSEHQSLKVEKGLKEMIGPVFFIFLYL